MASFAVMVELVSVLDCSAEGACIVAGGAENRTRGDDSLVAERIERVTNSYGFVPLPTGV